MRNLIVRKEKTPDISSITRINDLAFNRVNEGKLILLLRNHKAFDPRLSLVADLGDMIIGYVLFFPIAIECDHGIFPSLSLGPIAVLPEFQGLGVGRKLIQHGHDAAISLEYKSVLVLGHSTYYPRFGYKPAAFWGLTNPWEIHTEAFMALELVSGYLEDKPGFCAYPKAFNEAA